MNHLHSDFRKRNIEAHIKKYYKENPKCENGKF